MATRTDKTEAMDALRLPGCNILIVDDFEQMRVALRRMVSGVDAESVDSCGDGEEALKLLKKKSYQLVICDFNLGVGKDGQQVLEEARHQGFIGLSTVFLIVTAENYLSQVLGALELQPDDYLVKPISREGLLLRLDTVLRRKQQLTTLDEALKHGDQLGAIRLSQELRGDDPRQNLYLLKLEAELCLNNRLLERAEQLLQGVLAVRSFPWARFGLGKVYYLQGLMDQARPIFEALIEESKFFLEVYDWLALIHQRQDRSEEAQRLIQQAVRLSPRSLHRQRELGRLALRNGEPEVARHAFQAAVRNGRNSCFASAGEYNHLAELMHSGGNPILALQTLKEGKDRFRFQQGETARIFCGQARVRQALGQGTDAATLLDQAHALLDANPQQVGAEAKLDMADAFLQLGHGERGMEIMHALLANHQDEPEYMELAQGLFARHGLEQEGEALIERVSHEMVALNNRGVTLFSEGQVEEAISTLSRAAEKYPFNPTVNFNAAKVMITHMARERVDQGRLFLARVYLERVYSKRPGDAEVNKYMDALRCLQGNREVNGHATQ